MSEVIRQLNRDHINIARLLDLLEAELDRFQQEEDPDYVLMADIMQYMTNYPDLFHHPMEDVLFDRLVERNPDTASVVEELLDKHVVLADMGAKFAASLQTVLSEFMAKRETVESQGREYIAALRHHMDVEEGQIFPIAAKALDEDDWAYIDGAIKNMEDPLFGAAVQDEYRALYDYIKHQGD